MLSSADSSFHRNLPSTVFNQLGGLLQQTQELVEDALVLTDAVFARILIPQEWEFQRFTLFVSPLFSALLVSCLHPPVSQVSKDLGEGESFLKADQEALVNAKLTFHPEAIANFMSQLKDLFVCDCATYQNLERYIQIPRTNDGTIQGKFTLLLLECLLQSNKSDKMEVAPAEKADSDISHADIIVREQTTEEALRKQIAQEKLFNQVTTQIRKTPDLSLIMATAVEQVREFLELDRLIVYKIEDFSISNSQLAVRNSPPLPPSPLSTPHSPLRTPQSCVIYEVRANDGIVSVLNYQETDCFTPNSRNWDKYRQGFTLIVDDVEETYALETCFLDFLRQAKVRAKLAAPIMFEDKLWGLIVAHQCETPRSWTENEKNLLTSIGEQLAIAIYQNELMHSLTQEKQTLEQRVIERTMDLRDALMAAEAASRLRSEFLATMSHELLTPLTYVIGMSSTLLRWSFGELTERQRDYLQTIHDSGEHLLEMINDILDLSQIEAGKAVLNITEFSLTEIAETSFKVLLEKAQTQEINVNLDLQIKSEHDRFTADVRRIQQILWNLLSNAVKFTPKGGNVTLRLWMENDTAVFQVEDSGIGILKEQLPRLFEKFHQLDTPYRRRYEGTGLGLALTKQLIELHRGRIEVESTVNVGSVFTVWIPAQPIPVLQ
ncbi:MAG: GAF domain-containing protein [Scytonematopsis contorta HA4267-MV1]|jgi:two-component system sensor histidine kinase/response regulator|nr:GAF domain-containing protein [Scytonematopsis contorta HA4267-MV1]